MGTRVSNEEMSKGPYVHNVVAFTRPNEGTITDYPEAETEKVHLIPENLAHMGVPTKI